MSVIIESIIERHHGPVLGTHYHWMIHNPGFEEVEALAPSHRGHGEYLL